MALKATILFDENRIVSKIDDRLFGSFIEHMGRAVYTGIYEPSHPTANAQGFRQDVIDLIKPLNIPIIRYPGGNFVSGYNWEDGVGPQTDRPVRPELAWLAIETNQVGTNEFMDFLKSVDSKAMLAVNLGTGTPQDAVNLLEYCNFPVGTHYSDLRIAHGYKDPHHVKLWCLGNEMDGPWQIGAKTADEYGRIACETAKMMKWLDSDIELVVCGSSFQDMPTFDDWEKTVLRHTYEHVDYLSLHTYYMNMDNDVASFLASNVKMDHFIKAVNAICNDVKQEKNSEKDIYLSFDEWNIWYHFRKDCAYPEKWISARPIEEEIYDFADALLVGSMLTTLINNADTVKIACLAQLVNTIAPIMTVPAGPAWVQTIYFPFYYASSYGRGTALKAEVSCDTYDCAALKNVPYIDCAVVRSESDDTLTLFLINKHLSKDITCEIKAISQSSYQVFDWVMMNGYPLTMTNSADSSPIQPAKIDMAENSNIEELNIPATSWNMIRIKRI